MLLKSKIINHKSFNAPCGYKINQGFTLIEIVTALGIFILGFVSVLSLFTVAFRSQQSAEIQVTETLVGESVITTFREAEIPALKAFLQGLSPGDNGVYGNNIFESTDYAGYYYYISYETYGTTAEENRVYITVHVFEKKFKNDFDAIYTLSYGSLTQAQKEIYDNHCLKFYTILGEN